MHPANIKTLIVLALTTGLLSAVSQVSMAGEKGGQQILLIHENLSEGTGLAEELKIVFDVHPVSEVTKDALDPSGNWSEYNTLRIMQKLYAIAVLRDSVAVISLFEDPQAPETAGVVVYLVVLGTNSAVGRTDRYRLSADTAPDVALSLKELVTQGNSHLDFAGGKDTKGPFALPSGWQALEMPDEFQSPRSETATKQERETSPVDYRCSFAILGHARSALAGQVGPHFWAGGGLDLGCALHEHVALSIGGSVSKGIYSFRVENHQNAFQIEPRVGLGFPIKFDQSVVTPGLHLVPGISRYALSYSNLHSETFWNFSPRVEIGSRFGLNLHPQFSLFAEIQFGFNILRENFRDARNNEVLLRSPIVDAAFALGLGWHFLPKG